MKTTIMSIPGIISAAILKEFHDKNMECIYLGVDQRSRLLMKVAYKPEEEKIINEQLKIIEAFEKVVEDFITALSEAYQSEVKKRNAEKSIKERYRDLFGKDLDQKSKTVNTEENGKQERKSAKNSIAEH